jgi:hypothetical protein
MLDKNNKDLDSLILDLERMNNFEISYSTFKIFLKKISNNYGISSNFNYLLENLDQISKKEIKNILNFELNNLRININKISKDKSYSKIFRLYKILYEILLKFYKKIDEF